MHDDKSVHDAMAQLLHSACQPRLKRTSRKFTRSIEITIVLLTLVVSFGYIVDDGSVVQLRTHHDAITRKVNPLLAWYGT